MSAMRPLTVRQAVEIMIEDGWRDDEIIQRYGHKVIVWEVGVDLWLSDPPAAG